MKKIGQIILGVIIILGIGLVAYNYNSNKNMEEEIATEDGEIENQIKPIEISPSELLKMSKQKDYQLVNVHIPYAGEIEGTGIFIPFDEIETNLDKLPEDKNAKLVIYCRSGGMSALATAELIELGYTNVYDLQGGMNSWVKAGEEIIQK